jgi:hypothetical protein
VPELISARLVVRGGHFGGRRAEAGSWRRERSSAGNGRRHFAFGHKVLTDKELSSLARMTQAIPARADEHHQTSRAAEKHLQQEAVRPGIEIGNQV